MASSDMFVVLEWNQASHQPSVACGDVHWDLGEASDCAEELRAALHPNRREKFTVHQLEEVPDGD